MFVVFLALLKWVDLDVSTFNSAVTAVTRQLVLPCLVHAEDGDIYYVHAMHLNTRLVIYLCAAYRSTSKQQQSHIPGTFYFAGSGLCDSCVQNESSGLQHHQAAVLF